MNVNSLDFRSDRSSTLPLIRDRKGAILVLVAVCLVVFLGFLAMTLDVGAGNRQRRMAQTAADAGALAGAVELFRLDGVGFRHDSAVAAATREVIRNGFEAGDIVSPCPCNPPISGPHAGDIDYIEVRLSKSFATMFGAVFGQNSITFGARGVGGDVPFAQNCLVALSPTGSAITVTNGGSLSTTYVIDGHTYSCGVAVNSSDGSAIDVNQSGQLDAGTSSIGVVGGWDGNKTPIPAPVTGIPTVVDPLANLVQDTAITSCNTNDLATITKDTVLLPGVYCGGLTVSGKTATLSPGTYYIAGGGFHVVSSGVVNGDGVTIVMTNDVRAVGAGGKLPTGLDFGTGCKAKLTAASTGIFKGIVLYGDPAITNNPTNIFACASDESPEVTGIVYFPNQTLTFDGSNSGTEISGSVIASSIISSGKVSIISDLSGTSLVHHPVLVE